MDKKDEEEIDYRPQLLLIYESFWKRTLFEWSINFLLLIGWVQNIPIRWVEYQIKIEDHRSNSA